MLSMAASGSLMANETARGNSSINLCGTEGIPARVCMSATPTRAAPCSTTNDFTREVSNDVGMWSSVLNLKSFAEVHDCLALRECFEEPSDLCNGLATHHTS